MATALDANFEFLVNPTDFADWKSCVDQVVRREFGGAYAELKWRFSYNDYNVFLEIFGEDAFQLHVVKERSSGKVIGFVLFATHQSVNGSPRVAQLGCFYVAREYRGKGIGEKLFNRAVEKERNRGTNLTLNAALSMSPKYASRHGFDKVTDWVYCNIEIDIGNVDLDQISIDTQNYAIVNWNEVDLERILDFDKQIICGVDRRRYFTHQLRRDDAWTKIAVSNHTGSVIGMCTIKVIVGNRLMLCPLYADQPEIAESLLKTTLLAIPDLGSYALLQFYVPSTNSAAFALIDRLSQGKCRRGDIDDQSQFTHHCFPVPIDRVYNLNTYGLTFI